MTDAKNMTIVKTIELNETDEYNFIILEDEDGRFHNAYQFVGARAKEGIRRLCGDENWTFGYKTQPAARRALNFYIRSEYFTIKNAS